MNNLDDIDLDMKLKLNFLKNFRLDINLFRSISQVCDFISEFASFNVCLNLNTLTINTFYYYCLFFC